MNKIYELGFNAGMIRDTNNPYSINSEEFLNWNKGYNKGVDFAPPIISFSMERNSDVVCIFYDDMKIDEIKVYAFAKVIVDHNLLTKSKVSNKNYFQLCKLWASVSGELACEYRNRIDYDALDVLDQIVLTALGYR